MASSLWKSLVEAVNPEHPTRWPSGPHDHKVKRKPQPQMVWEEPGPDAVSKSALEHRGIMGDPDVAQVRDEAKVKQVPIREASLDSTPELGESGAELPSEELTAQIAVNGPIPTSVSNTSCVSGPALSMSHMHHEGEDFDTLGHSDLLEEF